MALRLIVLACWVLIAVPAAALQQTLVALDATWRYLDNGAAPGAGWTAPEYDDQAWASGPAELGYGDGDEATVVGYGANPNAKPITTWFRRSFTLPDASPFTRLDLRLRRDDGAVVYLNGVELRRDNLPAGSLTAATLASVAIGGADESTLFSSSIAAAALRSGVNVVAVELHQASASSSDISFALEVIASDGAARVTRGPYLQRATPGAMVVRWRTDLPTDSRVRYGPSVGMLNASATDAALTTEHVVSLSGLAPDATYVYAVGSSAGDLAGGDATTSFHTPPLAGTARRTRVWVIGDAGTGGAGARRVRDAYAAFASGAAPDLWMMLGDNAYTSGTDAEYQTGVFDPFGAVLRSSVLWPTLGNHDGQSADSATQSGPYYDIFTLPTAAQAGGVASGTEAYYSFDVANLHVVCLDSYDTNRAANGAMLTWLAADLAATQAEWVIAFWHHPPYSKGSHDSDSETELLQMRQNALPVLEAGGVDLVLSGHSHAYERSVLLDGHYGLSTTLTSGMVRDGGDGRVEGDGWYAKPSGRSAHQGAVYVVDGSSAQTGGGALNHPALPFAMAVLGSLVLDVEGPVLTGRFIDDAGAVRDAFTIVKGAAPLATLSGTLRYYREARPVAGAALSGSVASDAHGAFSLPVPRGAPVALRPQLSGSDTAVTALDAAWVLQAVAGTRSFDATQTLACDVTANGALSTLDASEILRRAVGVTSRVPAAVLCDSDFLFAPAASPAAEQQADAPQLAGGACRAGAIRFEPVTGSASGRDFVAAALGDCTGNWQPGSALAGLRERGSRVKVGRPRRVAQGGMRQIVRVSGAGPLSAVELSLRLPAGVHLLGARLRSPAVSGLVEIAPGGDQLAAALAQPTSRLRLELLTDAPRGAAPVYVTGARVDEQAAAVEQ
ncbi:MAG: metallophosphoesterase [Deltaproteobacteria bacterium]|nr:metallophosphoesterase [Deltaproteobacteria bacterium]